MVDLSPQPPLVRANTLLRPSQWSSRKQQQRELN
jgi:hypothetical protein